MKNAFLAITLVLISFVFLVPQNNCLANSRNLDLIPRPVRLTEKPGEMQVTSTTRILYTEEATDAADYRAERLGRTLGQSIRIQKTEKNTPVENAILLTTADAEPEPGEEGYYYTQKEMKDLVAYAAKQNVTIVPEIEMPGHAGAFCAGYPELLCTPPDSENLLNQNELCPGKETTFEILQKVLDEVMEIFPGPYIHIGGDECTRHNWVECPDCKKRMETEGLKNFVDLHGYFVQRIDQYVRSHGRRLVGWDEILESGAKRGAIGMYWRSGRADKIVENAAKEGQSLVISPTRFCYFDYTQSSDKEKEPLPFSYQVITTQRVFSLEPIPDYLKPEEHYIVLGAQGNLWGDPPKIRSKRQIAARVESVGYGFDSRSASSSLLHNVALYGSFAGDETSLNQRDLSVSHTTILPGQRIVTF